MSRKKCIPTQQKVFLTVFAVVIRDMTTSQKVNALMKSDGYQELVTLNFTTFKDAQMFNERTKLVSIL